ncbi:MAG: PAS domain-containing sensor histidine kinase [Deltaproteobacteria bacterium]|nr:PAS domain-containing sensor histidine kinase [Deltaproteobacteria bacterium]
MTGEVIFNERWAQMRGFRLDEIPPHVDSWLSGIHPDDLPRVRQTLDDHVAGRIPAYEAELRVRTRSGSWIWIMDRGRVFERDAQGRAIRMVGTELDITVRRQTEEALRRAIRARDEVLGIVAHDLRSPLSVITMQASLLRRCDTGPQRPADVIERSARRMNRLIEDLLDVTRIEAGHLAIRKRRLRPEQLVAEAMEANQALAASAGIELRLQRTSDCPDVLADGDRLLQVFANLIGNALKFTPAGGSVTSGVASRGDQALFWVADTGSGVSEADLPHLFDRYWQADPRERRGSGLGLPIAKGIVEAHDGRIWVESAVGRGCTVFFTIPSAAAPHAGREQPGESPPV